MKDLSIFLTEKIGDTDSWLYIFIPTYSYQKANWFLGDSNAIEWLPDNSKYVKIKTKKNLTNDQSDVLKLWKKKYPDAKTPSSFMMFINSVGDPEIEKCINNLIKLVDSGKTTLADFAEAWKKSGINHLNENPTAFKKILNDLK